MLLIRSNVFRENDTKYITRFKRRNVSRIEASIRERPSENGHYITILENLRFNSTTFDHF